ncbi:hypothetical protein NMY3_03678 [Candidatus Nitrosocosmicus oleophilus]|jgi:hypothetical protein|uniref:Uncharacterized protein n=1 Tax=Candidatus Nitrosocosmicus oleophilus TaxID=1353260 RepID=A0A654M425_9ARCH|nr:hypothetical protein [Candidatus Nitrosocosmicus oleophilus]ALI37860.1 hypothetical protein NMY3_03678 [Candidatus Nitrosocosmicus oleophilus]
MILPIPYGVLKGIMIVVSSTVDFDPLPANSYKFKHRIIVKRDSTDLTKVLTAFPVVDNETKELVAFVELKWERDDYNREIQ